MNLQSELYRHSFQRYLRHGVTPDIQLKAAKDSTDDLLREKWRSATRLPHTLVTQRIDELRSYFDRLARTIPDIPAPNTHTQEQEFQRQYREMLSAFADVSGEESFEDLSKRLTRAETFLTARFRQQIDPIIQPHYGVPYFIWIGNSEKPCAYCASHEGQTFAWSDGDSPPGCAHCQCTTAPSFDPPIHFDDPPIEPVYPELFLPIFRLARILYSVARRIRDGGSTLSEAQARNLSRFDKKLPKDAKEIQILSGKNGERIFRADVPARNIPGSFARYEKIVDKAGNTLSYTKTTFAPDGNIIHIKIK